MPKWANGYAQRGKCIRPNGRMFKGTVTYSGNTPYIPHGGELPAEPDGEKPTGRERRTRRGKEMPQEVRDLLNRYVDGRRSWPPPCSGTSTTGRRFEPVETIDTASSSSGSWTSSPAETTT